MISNSWIVLSICCTTKHYLHIVLIFKKCHLCKCTSILRIVNKKRHKRGAACIKVLKKWSNLFWILACPFQKCLNNRHAKLTKECTKCTKWLPPIFIHICVSQLSLPKSIPSFSDPFDELEELCEVSSSSSLATNALSSLNCNPTSPWVWYMLLVLLCVVLRATFGIFSFIILIMVCLRWPVLVKEKSYSSMSTLLSERVDVLNKFFLLAFCLCLKHP